jgi:hypothetical protein
MTRQDKFTVATLAIPLILWVLLIGRRKYPLKGLR